MITPTRTVCYAIPEEDAEQKLKVTYASPVGLTVEYSKGLCGLLSYSEVRRIIVREEPAEQYHPLMFHTSELPDLKIEPGEIKHYPVTECAKKFFLNADCLCEGCSPNLWPRHHLFMWSLLEKDMVRYKKEPKS